MYVLYETVLGVKALKWDFQLCNFSSTIHFSATNAKMHYSKKWREHSIITWYDTKSFKPQHISLSFHLKQCCKWVFLQSSSSRTAKWPPAELLVHVSHQTVRNKLHEGPMCFSESLAPCSSSISAWDLPSWRSRTACATWTGWRYDPHASSCDKE